MLELGEMPEIATELERNQIDVTAVQEIRCASPREISKKYYTVPNSGREKQGQYEVAFITMEN